MINMYRLPRNTVDVLTIGSSVAYTGVNTNVLWQEYGLACYNLCAAEQPFWFTYYQLREALRYQRPKVILMDDMPSLQQPVQRQSWVTPLCASILMTRRTNG